MARPAKVWYRADIGWWMITLGGEKTRLVQGPDDDHHRELAEEKYVELRKLRRLTPDAVNARTADIVEAFLKHSRLSSCHSRAISLCKCSSTSPAAAAGCSIRYSSLYDPSTPSCASSCKQNHIHQCNKMSSFYFNM